MFTAGFLIGLFGGMHCVLMCTPVALMLSPNRKPVMQLVYQSGRILVYVLLGLLAGLLGDALGWFGIQQGISIGMGLLIILITVIPALRKSIYKLPLQSTWLKRFRHALTRTGRARPFFAGILNGMLPCGLVYVGLSGALALGDAVDGMVFMTGFGVGTVPWLAGAVSSFAFLPQTFRKRAARVIPVIALSVGILFILRGLALDIPFISPALQQLGLPTEMTICS